MPKDDSFEGIDISGPWGGIRIGAGGVHAGRDAFMDEDDELHEVRRRVRKRLEFMRHLAWYVVVVGGLALIDWASGGGWWVQWVAIIWGGFLALQFLTTFVAPSLWGDDVEERMVQREMERRRGRVHVSAPPPPSQPPEPGA